MARPFEGLPGESDWVAMREIVPSATAPIRFKDADGKERDAVVATVLPMAWPAMHRADGQVLVALQSLSTSGDASRDVAQALLAAAALEQGTPVTNLPTATAETPRLQDVLVGGTFDVTVHEGFDFWLGDDVELDAQGKASMEQANDSAAPTVRLDKAGSAYWVRMGERCYIRWILPEDEEVATTAMARLQAAGDHLPSEDAKLLGAFRASGLLAPVFEVDPAADPESHTDGMATLGERYAKALKVSDTLTADERRARDGLVSRQVTLR